MLILLPSVRRDQVWGAVFDVVENVEYLILPFCPLLVLVDMV